MAPKKAAKKSAGTSAKKVAKKAAEKLPGKAAKKVAKKAAKKSAGHAGHDVRRAYEHLHRVGILHSALGRESLAQVDTLSRAAHDALASDDAKSAADLLRAAEHLSFGTLATSRAEPGPGSDLVHAAEAEYEHLAGRAAERWKERNGSANPELAPIFDAMQTASTQAWERGALHRALEFARGAEALTHASDSPKGLPAPRRRGRPRLRP